MRELPILFKAEMHRATRKGLKTETRRLFSNKQAALHAAFGWDSDDEGWPLYEDDLGDVRRLEPRYQVGDRLWVKEAWRARDKFDDLKPIQIGKRVGKEVRYELDGVMSFEQKLPFTAGKLRSPLFMPYWAARTWLEVTGVRAERLQEITEEGAKAEGVDATPMVLLSPSLMFDSYCETYRGLWDQINGKGSWEANPWVWVYQFKLLEAR